MPGAIADDIGKDVTQLIRLNNIDVHTNEIRKLFLKYGNADLYAKICRASELE